MPILLFDGVCNLCNTTVQWILKFDKKERFQFASLQSETGQRILAQLGMQQTYFDTALLIEGDKVYSHSDVPLQIVRYLGGLWPVLSVFRIVPLFIRNSVYNWVARNRYRWFGRTEQCWLPRPEWKARFLD